MLDRKIRICMLWLTSSLALLASVLIVPVRTPGIVSISTRSEHSSPNLARLQDEPTTCLNAAMTTDAVLQGSALLPESEEQDRADARNEPRISFLTPFSFRKIPGRQSIAPRSILSLYPLRC